MSIRKIGKNKFNVVEVTDGYIHNVYLRFTGVSFQLTNNGAENSISLRFTKKEFLENIAKFNPNNEIIYISKEDLDELLLFLNNPKEYAKEADRLYKEEQLAEKEEEIINEEIFEDYKDDYDSSLDNFNIDDVDSEYYE